MHIINVTQTDGILPEHKTIEARMSYHFPANITAQDRASLCLDVLNGGNHFAPRALLWNRNKNHRSARTSNAQNPEE